MGGWAMWKQMTREERLQFIRDGVAARMSTAQMGKLVGTSRNAIIGLAHRAKIQLMASRKSLPANRKRRERRKPPVLKVVEALEVPVKSPPFAPAPAPQKTILPARLLPKPPVEVMAKKLEVVPVSKGIPLSALTERTCKFPIGDPRDADFGFCGHDKDIEKPYCAFHLKLVYVPATQRHRGWRAA